MTAENSKRFTKMKKSITWRLAVIPLGADIFDGKSE